MTDEQKYLTEWLDKAISAYEDASDEDHKKRLASGIRTTVNRVLVVMGREAEGLLHNSATSLSRAVHLLGTIDLNAAEQNSVKNKLNQLELFCRLQYLAVHSISVFASGGVVVAVERYQAVTAVVREMQEVFGDNADVRIRPRAGNPNQYLVALNKEP